MWICACFSFRSVTFRSIRSMLGSKSPPEGTWHEYAWRPIPFHSLPPPCDQLTTRRTHSGGTKFTHHHSRSRDIAIRHRSLRRRPPLDAARAVDGRRRRRPPRRRRDEAPDMDGMGANPIPHSSMDGTHGRVRVGRDGHDPERHAANDRHGGSDVRRGAIRVGPRRGILQVGRGEWEGRMMYV